jgi:restriction system protein
MVNMARTYYAEGRQLAYYLRGTFAFLIICVWYFIPGLHWGVIVGSLFAGLIIAEIIGARWARKRRTAKKLRDASQEKKSNQTGKSSSAKKSNFTAPRRTSKECRSDEVILSSSLDDMSGSEFERLLALYFRDKGYTVKEVGVGGNDGGVDLVIIDKRGEKTAVQAKCYADHNKVSVQTVRELVAAKRNHNCILSLLITTSDLTAQAKKEAEQFKVEYWHGGLLEQKLKAWGKWHPGKG